MSTTTEKKLTGAAAKAHEAKIARENGETPNSDSTPDRTTGGHQKANRVRHDTPADPRDGSGEIDQATDGDSLINPGESHNDAEKRLHMALTKDGRPAGQGPKTPVAEVDPSEYGLKPGESHNDAEKRLHMPLDAAGMPLSKDV